MKFSGKYLGLTLTCVAALGLSACGGDATVENDPATELSSVAPLTRESASPSESSSASSSPGSPAPAPQSVEPQPRDGAAEEIEEIPEQTISRSPQETDYLDQVKEGGVDITTVEEQLIGAASTVCESVESGNPNVIVPAVAGQLVEQGRTDLAVEDVTSLIESAAESAYC